MKGANTLNKISESGSEGEASSKPKTRRITLFVKAPTITPPEDLD